MKTLRNLYLKLDLFQQRLWFRIIASALAVIICGVVFGSLIVTSYSLERHRAILVPLLFEQSYQNRDELAVSLYEDGSVTVNGRKYVSSVIANRPEHIFDQKGVIGSPRYVANRLLEDQQPRWAPDWLIEQPDTTWLLSIATLSWLLMVIWLGATAPLLITTIATGIPLTIGGLLGEYGRVIAEWPVVAWLMPWFLSDEKVMLYIAGFGLFTFTFVLLTRMALFAYGSSNQILSVAHTVLKEASRTRLSLVFIILLLLILPLLPLNLDPDSPLRYRVQTFLSRSFAVTFSISAVLTIFLSCASIAFEIRDRQIWHLMTKPLNRMNYLIGKWLGVMTLNLIILIVAGLSTFTYIQYLRKLPVAPGIDGQLDALAVSDQVLTARKSVPPTYQKLTREQLQRGEEQIISQDSELYLMEEVPLSVRRYIREDLQRNFDVGQRTISSQNSRSFLFTKLQEAKNLKSSMTLRYRFYIMGNDEHEVFQAIFRFNDDPTTDRIRNYVPTQAHVLPIGTDLIREDGTLKLDIYNLYVPPPDKVGALNFEADGLELMHKVANFEGNFFRAIMMTWVKLAFLAALGTCCATFLSFSVACMMAFTIFIAGMLGPFVADSLETYTLSEWSRIPDGNIGQHIQWIFIWTVNSLAHVIVSLLKGFGEYKPAQNLVEGKLIPWSDVLIGFMKLGIAWSGLSMLIGWLVIRSRQLAIYSGEG